MFLKIDDKITACSKTLTVSEAGVECKRARHFVFWSTDRSSSVCDRLGLENKTCNKTLFVSKTLMVSLLSTIKD